MDAAFFRNLESHFTLIAVTLLGFELYIIGRLWWFSGRSTSPISAHELNVFDYVLFGTVSVLALAHLHVVLWTFLQTLTPNRRRFIFTSVYACTLGAISLFMASLQCVEIRNAESPAQLGHSIVVLILWIIIFLLCSFTVRLWYFLFCCHLCQSQRTRVRLKQEYARLVQQDETQMRLRELIVAASHLRLDGDLKQLAVVSGSSSSSSVPDSACDDLERGGASPSYNEPHFNWS